MAGYTFDTLRDALAEVLVVPSTDPNFLIAIPSAILSAEEMICTSLDFLGAVQTSTIALTANNRALPNGNDFFVIESMNVITPAGQTNPDLGTRNPLLPATKEFCDFTYPSSAGAGVPQYFARVSQAVGVLAPWPDAAYTIEITGTQRPTTLSSGNQTNFISTYLPQLLFAGCMIWLSGWQQNFSASGDNPQQGVNWKSYFDTQLAGAQVEESRKKFTAEGWSSKNPAPLATPPRT